MTTHYPLYEAQEREEFVEHLRKVYERTYDRRSARVCAEELWEKVKAGKI